MQKDADAAETLQRHRQKDAEVAERATEAMQRHRQAIDAMRKDAAGKSAPGSSQDHLKNRSSAPGSSQDHLRLQRSTPKINSTEEAKQMLVDLGWARAVRQQ